MSNPIATLAYNKLVSDICDIYEAGRLKSVRTVNKVAVRTHYNIGRRIVEDEQRHSLRATYGVRLLESLSSDLTKKYGRGFSLTNLKYMRQFYLTYRIGQLTDQLGWTHYQVLLAIKDKEKRYSYERRAIKQNWDVQQLEDVIKRDKVDLEELIKKQTKKGKSRPAPKLNLTRGSLYTYRLIKPKYIASTVSPLVVDCGFYISRALSLSGISNPKDKDIVESAKIDKGYKFISSSATKKQLYTYKAFVERVVDADTVWVNIDCGFNTFSRQKLRLRGIDAPELYSKKGQKAKEFVEGALSKVSFIIIKSYSLDKYGRPLSDIFYLEGEPDPQKVLERGTFLNQQLLDLGLAKIVE